VRRAGAIVVAGVAMAASVGSAGADEVLPRLPLHLPSGGLRARMAMRSPAAVPVAVTVTVAVPVAVPVAVAVAVPVTVPVTVTVAVAVTVAVPVAVAVAVPVAVPVVVARRKRRPASRAAPTVVVPSAHAQLSLGLAVDGAGLTASGATAAGTAYNAGGVRDYSPARAYAFGEAFLGTRGLIVPGISAYLASQFQFAPATTTQVPIMRAWDRVDPFQIRTAWTDADGIFDVGALRTLRVRGGRQYVYGPAVAHLDGLSTSWKTSRVRLGGYLGSRVPDWFYAKSGDAPPRGLVTGGELAVVLRRGRTPLALRARGLIYGGATHSDFTVDWTARRDLVLAISSRLAGRELAREHITARYRWSDVTRIVLDADLRHRADWLWDYELRDDATGPRRYLDLGPRLPRVGVKLRAGTVLLDNIDLLVFGGFAVDSRGDDETPSYTAAGWAEGGGSFEVRMRRTFALSFSGLTRVYNRADAALADRLVDRENAAAPLTWTPRHVGERSLVEGGVVGKFSGGARRFSVSGEIYLRRTRYAALYQDDTIVEPMPEAALDAVETHGGGRFVLEAWISPAMRVRTEYDLSNRLSVAPETDGLKSLRLIAEGRY